MATSDPQPPLPSCTELPIPVANPIETAEKPAVSDVSQPTSTSTSDAPASSIVASSTTESPAPEVPTADENPTVDPSTIPEADQNPPVSEEHPALAKDRELPAAVEMEEDVPEESFYLKDLKASQKKALMQFKAKIQAAIMDNSFLDPPKPVKVKKVEAMKEEQNAEKEEEGEKTEEATEEDGQAAIEPPVDDSATAEAPLATDTQTDTITSNPILESTRDVALESTGTEEQEIHDNPVVVPPTVDDDPSLEDLALWGIPLLHSKGDERTDVLLLKFLRARDFKPEKALNMLQDTLLWRKEFNTDGLIGEETPDGNFDGAFIHGMDRQGHPVCYNGELSSKKSVEDEAQLKRRIQVLERGIQTLDFSPNGIHSMVQVIDFAGHSPAFLGRGVRSKILELLQNNYPELVAKQIFINVPWYFPPLLSLFNPRTRSKAVLAKPGRVAETLFKYISPDQVPVQYGGLSRLNDTEFAAVEAPVTQIIVKAGEKQSIELPVPNAGRLIWDISVIGWDVLYDEEFVPNEGYIKIIRKASRIAANEETLRNTFDADAPGKMVLTIDNTSSRRRRVVVYRYSVNSS